MNFNWIAGIALWTVLSGPAMYGSGPAPRPTPFKNEVKKPTDLNKRQIPARTCALPRR